MQNLEKALQVLQLPDSAGTFNGLTGVTTTRTIVNKVLTDFTNRVNGKPTVTSTFEIVETKTSTYKVYALNYLNMMAASGLVVTDDSVDNFVMDKPKTWVTVTVGTHAGKTFWYPGQTVVIQPSGNFYNLDLISDLGSNVTSTGAPEPTNGENPLMTIRRESYIKTATFTSARPSVSYPKFGIQQLCTLMNTTLEELKHSLRSTYTLSPVDVTTRIANTAVEGVFVIDNIEPTSAGNLYGKINVYYNGIDTNVSRPSGLTTSYDKPYPGHVVRWKLYNEVVNDTVYGTSVTVKFDSTEDSTISIVAGNAPSYDPITKTLTFDKSKDAVLCASFEELPAQGKNWGGETQYLLFGDTDILPVRL